MPKNHPSKRSRKSSPSYTFPEDPDRELRQMILKTQGRILKYQRKQEQCEQELAVLLKTLQTRCQHRRWVVTRQNRPWPEESFDQGTCARCEKKVHDLRTCLRSSEFWFSKPPAECDHQKFQQEIKDGNRFRIREPPLTQGHCSDCGDWIEVSDM